MADQYTINKDELVCAICVESWLEKDPRTLPCQHTFCLKCLKKLRVVNVVECPICRRQANVPNRDVTNFPKSLLIHAIEKVATDCEMCTEHDKKAYKPLLCCKTCKKTNLCNECLEQNHSGSLCCIVTQISLENGVASLKDNFKALIDKQREKDGRAEFLLLSEIDQARAMCQAKIDTYFDATKKRIKKYFDKKDTKLKLNSNESDCLFLDEKAIEKNLKSLFTDPLPVINCPIIKCTPELNFSFSQNMVDTSRKKFIKVRESQFVIDQTNAFWVANEGFYYIMESQLDILYFKPSLNNDVTPILLDREIGNFVVTDRYIYAVDNGTNLILFSKKPFGHRITLELFEISKTHAIRATEDDYGQRFVQTFWPEEKECKFFINETFEWSVFDCKDVGCILHNGYTIVRTVNDKLVMLDKYNGAAIRSIDCPLYSIQYDYSPYGILMTNETINDVSWTSVFLFDYDLNMIKSVEKFHNASILGITKDGIVGVYTFDHKIKCYKFK